MSPVSYQRRHKTSGGLTPKVSCSYILRAMPPNGMVHFFGLGQACVDHVTTIAAGFVLLSTPQITLNCSNVTSFDQYLQFNNCIVINRLHSILIRTLFLFSGNTFREFIWFY